MELKKKYVVKNCPCYNITIEGYDCLENPLSWCENIDDCLMKRIINDVSTVYRTPEYFEQLVEKGDEEQYLIECAWHNVAHMVMSKVDIEEVE